MMKINSFDIGMNGQKFQVIKKTKKTRFMKGLRIITDTGVTLDLEEKGDGGYIDTRWKEMLKNLLYFVNIKNY